MLARVSRHALIIACRVRPHRFNIDAVEQPMQLLGSELEHRFLTRPNETILLEPLHQQPEAVTVPQQHLDAIAALIAEEAFEWLDAPVIRVASIDTPVPYSPPLEDYYLPQTKDVVEAARKLAAY